jgi:putative transposase
MPLLDTLAAKQTFEAELERVRVWYGCYITGYVVMAEHVHLLISEPERSKMSVTIQMLKQITSRKLRRQTPSAFLAGSQLRFSGMDGSELHREAALHPSQPSKARTGGEPKDWKWSSFVH